MVFAFGWPAGTAWSCSTVRPSSVPSSIVCSRFSSAWMNSAAVIIVGPPGVELGSRSRDDRVFSRDDERGVGGDVVRLVGPHAGVLGGRGRRAPRLRVLEPRHGGAVISRRAPPPVSRRPGIVLHVAPLHRERRSAV